MKRLFLLFVICLIFNCLSAQKPLSLASSFYNTLNNYVLYNDHIEYQKLMNMCDAGFRVSDRFAQEQSDIPSPSLLLQSYLELLRDKQVKLAITDMREITLSNHRTEGAPTKTVLVNLSLSSPKISTYKLQNVVYIRNNKIFCVGDYEVDKSGKVLADVVNKTNRTSTNNNIHNGHEYVDLGLSVMWATCNVGADNPYEYGDYFAWGEITSKNDSYWHNYKFSKGKTDRITKYCTKNRWGNIDNCTRLYLSDDAANSIWGSSWRMPSQKECRELIDNCICSERMSVNGYYYFKLTSKKNGAFIIIPAGGQMYKSCAIGRNALYWSSELDIEDSREAYHLIIDYTLERVGANIMPLYPRYALFLIRPVFSPK